jgi:hypothetical protein
MSNRILGILFIVIAVIAVIVYFPSGDKTERTFRTELMDVDTSAISEIIISPKSMNGESFRIFKANSQWNVTLANEKTAVVPREKTDGLIKQILSIKPVRLASRNKVKWAEFEVDSSATRVIVKEGGDTTLDIMIGKFLFQQPRSVSTYVRLNGDSDVYLVDGFISMTFNQGADSYRNNIVVKGDPQNWEQLVFSYPADSSFQISKISDEWFSNGVPLDSAKTEKYLSQLARLTNSNFVNDFDSESASPIYKLTISDHNSTIATVNGYQVDSLIVVNSSLNNESYFNASENNFMEKLFIGINLLK